MKTSPFSPWTDAASGAPSSSSSDTSADLLQQAAQQLADAATRLASLELPGTGASTPSSIQITVTTPLGDPLPFTSDPGPDLTLLT